MVRTHVSERRYDMLSKYDNLLSARSDRENRYFIAFAAHSRDYFVYKLTNKLMRRGGRATARRMLLVALSLLKQALGFQPFYLFRHTIFRMRQLFKIQKTVLRKIKTIYLPLLLRPHNQITYGIDHIIRCSKQLAAEDNISMSHALGTILLNCFVARPTLGDAPGI